MRFEGAMGFIGTNLVCVLLLGGALFSPSAAAAQRTSGGGNVQDGQKAIETGGGEKPKRVSSQGRSTIRAGVATEEGQSRPNGLEGTFVAFSLAEAARRIAGVNEADDYRLLYPALYELGGIRRVYGLVYDRDSDDVILVGRADTRRRPLTIDDLAVALRARFTHGEWPLVSIDPPKSGSAQPVRFGGGLENTQFGADLLDADYRLKLIGFGHLRSGASGMLTYFDLSRQSSSLAQGPSESEEQVRFWFYPVLSNVAVRNDVAAIGTLRVQVLTERMDTEGIDTEHASYRPDPDAVGFATAINERFDEIAAVHSSFARLPGLEELVAMTVALDRLEAVPDLSFWLDRYHVKRVEVPTTIETVSRKHGGFKMWGGVRLMALALRLKAGDVSALKEAVLRTRPRGDSVYWTFSIGQWVILTSPGLVGGGDLGSLYAQAQYFQSLGYNSEAIELLDEIIELAPTAPEPYRARAVSLLKLGRGDASSEDFERAGLLESLAWRDEYVPARTRSLVWASHKGDARAVRHLLAEGVDVNSRGISAFTGLAAASDRGHREVVKILLAHGADPEVGNYMGSTPLLLAAEAGHSEVVEALIERGASVDAATHEGNTALEAACLNGHYAIATALIAGGAKVNQRDMRGHTPLMAASIKGHSQIVRLLLENGAAVDAVNHEDSSPLMSAVVNEHVAVVEALLEGGAGVERRNRASWTPLLLAALKGNPAVVGLLIESGADLNTRDTEVEATPLHVAAQLGNTEVAELLLGAGANANVKDVQGGTPLHWGASHDNPGDVMDVLLARGAEKDATANGGLTALMVASQKGHARSVEALVRYGADLSAKSVRGATALDLAMAEGHDPIVTILREAETSRPKKKTGRTSPYRSAPDPENGVICIRGVGSLALATPDRGSPSAMWGRAQPASCGIRQTLTLST